jgi:hypothetical protein
MQRPARVSAGAVSKMASPDMIVGKSTGSFVKRTDEAMYATVVRVTIPSVCQS